VSTWPQQLALVMLGGALGAAGRFWLGSWVLRHAGNTLPWGTLAANLAGALLAGFVAEWLQQRGPAALYWRAFLMVGLLGGLTTFSAVMVETLMLGRSDRVGLLVYLGLTLAGGFAMVWLGARLGTALRPG